MADYKVNTLMRSRTYSVETLHTQKRVVSVDREVKEYEVNKTPINVTVNMQGNPQVAQDLSDHIADLGNPHEVQVSQLPDGNDLTIIFNNALL